MNKFEIFYLICFTFDTMSIIWSDIPTSPHLIFLELQNHEYGPTIR